MARTRLSLGVVTGPHGVRGQFKVKPFTDSPDAIDAYGPVWLEDGRTLSLKVKSVSAKGFVLVGASEITSRDQAEALKGALLYVDRAVLPSLADDEIYHADLIGMTVETAGAGAIGKIIGIHDFGAGEIVEIKSETGPGFMVPFGPANRAGIDYDQQCVTVILPDGMLELARGGAGSKIRQPGKRTQDE